MAARKVVAQGSSSAVSQTCSLLTVPAGRGSVMAANSLRSRTSAECNSATRPESFRATQTECLRYNCMSFDDRRRLCLARGVRLQTDPANGEPILLFPEGVLYLSATANDIVQRCDGQSSALTIIAALADEYDVSPETLRGDVLECLSELRDRKLVVFSE